MLHDWTLIFDPLTLNFGCTSSVRTPYKIQAKSNNPRLSYFQGMGRTSRIRIYSSWGWTKLHRIWGEHKRRHDMTWKCVLMAVVCEALSDGAAAVFGLMSSASSTHLRSLCAAIQLPHIDALNDDDDPDPNSSSQFNYTVNVFPHHALLSRALVDFVKCQQWKSVALLYINDDSKFTANRNSTAYYRNKIFGMMFYARQVNLPLTHSLTQSINQSVNQSINQSMKWDEWYMTIHEMNNAQRC